MAQRPDAARLLSLLADALNACDRAGLKVSLHSGIAETRGGCVIPLDIGWEPRVKTLAELSPEDDSDDD